MPSIVSNGAIEIAPGRGDLRYGSVPSNSLATPSWYGLHDSSALALTSGQTVSYAKLFTTQPVISSAVKRLQTWAYRVPLKVYKRTSGGNRERLRAEDHPFAQAIHHPWRGGSALDLTETILGNLLVHGNGLVQVEQDGQRLGFRERDWRYMRPILSDPRVIEGWETDELGYQEQIAADVLLHVRTWSPVGPLGISPLQQLGVTLRIEEAAQQYAEANLRNMARPPSAITVDNSFLGFEPEERQAAIDMVSKGIREMHQGPENAGKVAILPSGLKWEGVSHTAQEAELIEQRKINRNEVAMVYMIPPPMLGILDEATYSNIEVQKNMSYTDSLGPYLVQIEAALNAQVGRELLGDDSVFVEYEFAGVLRGDRLQEVQAMREAINTGLLTINEGRTTLNYPKSDEPNADQLWMQTNNAQPISEAGQPNDDNTSQG